TRRVNALLAVLAKAPPQDYQAAVTIAKSLYDILIRPVTAFLNPGCVLFIVPDKILNYLPFATLICPETGRYFVEDFAFALAPSSSLMISCSERAREKGAVRVEKILAVGNPNFDHAEFPSLPDLPSAAREAESVARLYGSASLLVGHDAQPYRVKAEMVDADVIHFAGHYVENERSPIMSRLLLSKTDSRAGAKREGD